MGNSAVYGQRKFENLDYDEGVARADIATTAVNTTRLKDGAVTTAKTEAELKTGQIIVQLGAGGGTHYLNKPAHAITLTKLEVFGSVAGATSTSTAGLTVTLKSADAGGATTATVAGGVATLTATTSTLVKSVSEALSASIAATKGLYIVAGATTAVDDNASAVIQYTID